jgi:nucleotide-binding universal stress UspA family protein
MIDWREISCAVDFGELSRMAMEQAADLAARFGAELTLVHVGAPPVQAESDVLVSSRGISKVEAEEKERTLLRWAVDAAPRAGRVVKTRVLRGDPGAEIVRYTREERCDLLVLGTHGRKGLSRLVLGSVAERAAREASCPVLVVHDHEMQERERAAEEIAQYR